LAKFIRAVALASLAAAWPLQASAQGSRVICKVRTEPAASFTMEVSSDTDFSDGRARASVVTYGNIYTGTAESGGTMGGMFKSAGISQTFAPGETAAPVLRARFLAPVGARVPQMMGLTYDTGGTDLRRPTVEPRLGLTGDEGATVTVGEAVPMELVQTLAGRRTTSFSLPPASTAR
jgi:hypothetical protein